MTAPKTPQDRLGKLPRRVTVGIYLDDDTVAVVNDTAADLAAAVERLDASRPRRIAEARAAGSPEDVIDPEGIRADVDHSERVELAPLEAAATAALDAMDAATTWFTFRSLGRKAFKALLGAHPATDAHHELIAETSEGGRAPYNLDTFPQALVQAACIDPVLSDEDIDAIFDGECWNDVEINTLVAYAQIAQSQAPVADLKRRG
jgi:hypothetical protein